MALRRGGRMRGVRADEFSVAASPALSAAPGHAFDVEVLDLS